MKFDIEIQFVQVFLTLLLAWGWWLNQWRPFQTAVTEEISKNGWPASQVPQLPRTPVASGLGNLTSGLQPFDLLFKCAFSFHKNLCSKILLLRNTRFKRHSCSHYFWMDASIGIKVVKLKLPSLHVLTYFYPTFQWEYFWDLVFIAELTLEDNFPQSQSQGCRSTGYELPQPHLNWSWYQTWK